MSGFKPLTFKRVSRVGKVDLCMLGELVDDETHARRIQSMTDDERKRVAQATKHMILLVMTLIPRRL